MKDRTLNGQFIELLQRIAEQGSRDPEIDKAIRFYYFQGARAMFLILNDAREASTKTNGEGGVLLRRAARELREYEHELETMQAKALRGAIQDGLAMLFQAAKDKGNDTAH